MNGILIGLGLLALIAVLTVINIALLANLGIFFAKIAQSTTAFFVVGDKLHAIWPNVTGYVVSNDTDTYGRQWLIPLSAVSPDSTKNVGRIQKWMWEELGVRFVSLLWFNNKIHTFDIRSRKRIRERAEMKAEDTLRNRVVDSSGGETRVNNLLFVVPRPVYLEGVELAGDNARVNLLLLLVFRQIIPAVPVFDLKGDFFTLLDAAIEAEVVDFFASHRVAVNKDGEFVEDAFDKKRAGENHRPAFLTYSHWLKLTKAGDGSPLVQHLKGLNLNKEYLESLRKKGTGNELIRYIESDPHLKPGEQSDGSTASIQSGIVSRFGFALTSIRSVEWEVHKDTGKLADALLARETEYHAAAGVREKAFGERDSAVARAEGDTSRYQLPVKALVDLGVTPDVAASVLATQLRTENIRQAPGLATYVEGGASASIMVDASKSKPT